MRQPINRGIPKPLMRSVTAVPLFKPSANVDDVYWVTAFYRPTVDVVQDPIARYVRYSSLPALEVSADPENKLGGRAFKILSGCPMQGVWDRISIGFSQTKPLGACGVWYGHVEIGEEDLRIGDRPFATGRSDDTFVLTPLHLSKQDPLALVHMLDPNYVDLVTLHVLLPPEMELELRFFDGTYNAGQAQYQAHVVRNENPYNAEGVDNVVIDELFFDRHPMRGPGSIQAVVKAANSDDDHAFVYGTVFR